MTPSISTQPITNFSIPSEKDALTLQCRIYHPEFLHQVFTGKIKFWIPKAAIIAHPYAPLGGSMDDHVVNQIASTCLPEGFIVGTFNFRGAGDSEGHTSWQGKSEQSDYRSFIGFMVYYLYYLYAMSQVTKSIIGQLLHEVVNSDDPLSLDTLIPILHNHDSKYLSNIDLPDNISETRIRLLLAGYSYGALITMSLPTKIQEILLPYKRPLADSNHAKIRQQAEKLARKQSYLIVKQIVTQFYLHRNYPSHSRNSQDSIPTSDLKFTSEVQVKEAKILKEENLQSRSMQDSESIDKKNVENSDDIQLITRKSSFLPGCPEINENLTFCERHTSEFLSTTLVDKSNEKSQGIDEVKDNIVVAYLLISPLQGLLFDLLTLWSYRPWRQKSVLADLGFKLKFYPTLAIYGEGDVFVSAKNIRNWAEKLQLPEVGQKKSQFRYVEVAGAGHFWHEHQSIKTLQVEIAKFISIL